MNFEKRKSVYTELINYCYHAKPGQVIEVTEWTNGEGWDIAFGDKHIALTMGELLAIEVLTKVAHPK